MSTVDLKTDVLKTDEAPFFAGFVSGLYLTETGPLAKGSTKFSKGFQAYQTHCVKMKFGNKPYLRTNGLDKVLLRLSAMKGFTKEYWGLRGTIAALLKETPGRPVSNLNTYMLPKAEVLKVIRTKLPFDNGGLFRTEEIVYLSERYSRLKDAITGFTSGLDNPTLDFVEKFDGTYATLKSGIERCDAEIKLLAINRSKRLFPEGKKKAQLKFKKLPLNEKIQLLYEKHSELFRPESLPGITYHLIQTTEEVGTTRWKQSMYAAYDNAHIREIIDTWYSNFTPSAEDDE